MQPEPDPRWRHIIGGLAADGAPLPMSFGLLAGVADEWRELVADTVPAGIRELLATSRSLFAHAWFDYDFMAIACLVSFQAVEATLRQVVFPQASKRTSLHDLVDRAEREGRLRGEDAERVRAAVKLRNSLAHLGVKTAYSVGMAGPVIQRSHLVVDALCGATGP